MYALIDIDGSLADIKHRLHYVQSKNYDLFYDKCVDDKPIQHVIDMVEGYYEAGYEIIFVSGRPDSHREQTERWLYENVIIYQDYNVYMRKEGDYRPDYVVKRELYNQIVEEKGEKPAFVIDDRYSVIEKCWRPIGIPIVRVGDWFDEERKYKVEPGTLYVMIGPSGCLSGDHEVLTPSGWIHIDKWNGEEILHWQEDGSTFYSTPLEYINEPCNKFYHFRSPRIDLKVSEEHVIPYIKKYNPETLRKNTASEIYESHILLASGWDGNLLTTFTAPDNTKGIPLSEVELRLMVAICADGHFAWQGTTRCIVCLRKQRKKDRLVALLNEAGISYERRGSQSRPTEERFVFYAPENNKRISAYWKANQQQLKIISEEVFYWDGSINQEKGSSYCSVYKEDCDFVQYALSASGFRSQIMFYPRQKPHHKDWYQVSKSNWKHATIRGGKGGIDIIEEESRKYCFSTTTGFFVTRRNNKICITGNSGKTTLAQSHPELSKAFYVSSDAIRKHVCGDFKDQTKNDQVFQALHDITRASVINGVPTVVDATNIRTRDRKRVVECANGGPVVYVVVNRPMEEKVRDGGWRNEVDGLLDRHENTMKSNLKVILAGDNLSNVTVWDMRNE